MYSKKYFQSSLEKSDIKTFDKMVFSILIYTIHHAILSAKLVRIQPIFMSIIFHHYKQLIQLTEQIKAEEKHVNKQEEKTFQY